MAADVAILHPFEGAGLGLAPFRYVGFHTSTFQASPESPVQPGSSCDYCCTAIRNVFDVVAADGRKFHVGSDCIAKVHRETNTELPLDARRIIARAQQQKRDEKRQGEWARLCERVAKCEAILAAAPALFTDKKHPNDYRASLGETLRDYYFWMLRNGGVSGRTMVCKATEANG